MPLFKLLKGFFGFFLFFFIPFQIDGKVPGE